MIANILKELILLDTNISVEALPSVNIQKLALLKYSMAFPSFGSLLIGSLLSLKICDYNHEFALPALPRLSQLIIVSCSGIRKLNLLGSGSSPFPSPNSNPGFSPLYNVYISGCAVLKEIEFRRKVCVLHIDKGIELENSQWIQERNLNVHTGSWWSMNM
jgi:hypothetical protein